MSSPAVETRRLEAPGRVPAANKGAALDPLTPLGAPLRNCYSPVQVEASSPCQPGFRRRRVQLGDPPDLRSLEMTPLLPPTPPASSPLPASLSSRSERHRRADKPPSPPPLPAPSRARRQCESDAEDYLGKLLWLSRCSTLRNPTPTMVDFLSSFNLGPETAAPSNAPQCDSVNELQLNLQATLEAKTTPTRAEHVSTTLELRPTAQFSLNLSESENDALEGLANIDPSLGGVRSTNLSAESAAGRPLRVVTASETLANRSDDNPVLQRSVAKLIISAVSVVDESTWTVRQVSRSSQGWTFTYLCKGSYQQWNRQHSKSRVKPIIGESSQGEPDPYLENRPAFDCRGSITIAFSQDSRSITVRYDHTPLHKTVAQVAEMFKPPPRQLGPGAVAQQQKTPKKPISEGRKKKRQPTNLDENGNAKAPRARKLDESGNPISKKRKLDEDGNPIPRKKKNKNTGEGQMPPDYPAAPSTNAVPPPGPPYVNGQQSTDGDVQGFNDYPQGLVNDATSQAQTQAVNSASFPINVSPEEAARRREVAAGILRDAGVDPDSLSADQFNIFSNQSPDLQKDSLNMLAKYGAERLRIVHPSNRESSASASASASATPVQAIQPTPSGPMTTKELVPQSQDPVPKDGARNRQSVANENGNAPGDEMTAQDQPETATKTNRSGVGKSRVACYQCKDRKAKCPHEKPACAECEAAGITCEYPPQKPRSRKKKSDAIISIDDDQDEVSEPSEAPQPEQIQQNGEEHHEGPAYSSYTQMPVADLLTPNVEGSEARTAQPTYFQQAPGLALPQNSLSRLSEQALSASGLTLPHGQTYDTTQQQVPTAVTLPPQNETPIAETSLPKQSKRRAKASASNSRRSLPSGPSQQQHGENSGVNPLDTRGWPSANNAQHPEAPTDTMLHTTQHQTNSQHHSRGPSFGQATDTPEVRDDLRQAAALSQVPAQRQQSPSVAAGTQHQARASPFQPSDKPRSQSRQSQRAQSRTPRGQVKARGFQAPTAPPQHQEAGHDAATRQVALDLTDLARYNNFARYQEAEAPNDASGNRITYEPYSQQKSAANAPSFSSYNYPRNTTTGQPATTMASSQYQNNAQSDSWMGSQNRDAPSHGSSGATYAGSGSYAQNSGTAGQSSRSDLGSLNQRNQQQQGYNSYPAQPQQQNQGQAASQPPGWYNFHGMPENGGPRYDWKLQDQQWPGMS